MNVRILLLYLGAVRKKLYICKEVNITDEKRDNYCLSSVWFKFSTIM